MDLDLISSKEEPQSAKIIFLSQGGQSKGLVLQLHPYFVEGHSEKKKCTFLLTCFSENFLLAATDSNGNIYIIDLERRKYWKMPQNECVSAISFPPRVKASLLIAVNSGDLQVLNIDKGSKTAVFVGHSAPVKEISYSYDEQYCLTANTTEAIIWDLPTCTQAHKLSLREDMLLKKAVFMSVQDSIFACFQDDAMHVWKFWTFDCYKQLVPENWKTHDLKSIAFSKNGRLMVVGGCTPNIMVFSLDTWEIKKVIQLPSDAVGIKHLEFVPLPTSDSGNTILGIVTENSKLCFLDINSLLFYNNLPGFDKNVGTFSVGSRGRYLARVLTSGEIDIYLTQYVMDLGKNTSTYLPCPGPEVNDDAEALAIAVVDETNKKGKQKWAEELKAVRLELKEELTLRKLLPMLKQFGEYPESYRLIIWRTILQLPTNQEAYNSLASKEWHPSYANMESKYPLANKALSNGLKRALSNLAHWCTLFSEVSFLPEFIFPFVKLMHSDPFVCFESIATVIVNWCQNWFEFYPFPPINVLTIIENVLGYHDSDLLEYYYEKNITSCSYAYSLMQTAFSDVLSKNEWLRLWDHIISNEPSFILMVVIAYNVVCRNAIKNCETNKDVEVLFHNQNVMDFKLLLKKSYYFMDKTPEDIHPRRYLSPFSPLPKGDTYITYEAYPKLILDRNAARLNLIQKQEQEIIQEQRKAIAIKKELDKKLKTDHEADFREEVLNELDEKLREIVNAEEERITVQRKKLRNLRRELKLKELSVLEEARDQMIRKMAQKKKMEIERLMKDIAAREAREKSELKALEDEIRNYYSNLMLHKFSLKQDLVLRDRNNTKHLSKDLEHVEAKLMDELGQNEVTNAYCDKKIELGKKIEMINDMLQKVEIEVMAELAKKDNRNSDQKSKREIEKLWKETEIFEKKLQSLLGKEITGTPHGDSRLDKKGTTSETEEEIQSGTGKSSEDAGGKVADSSLELPFLNQGPSNSEQVRGTGSHFRKIAEHDYSKRLNEIYQPGRSNDSREGINEKCKAEEREKEKCHFQDGNLPKMKSKLAECSTSRSSRTLSESEESGPPSKSKNDVKVSKGQSKKGNKLNETSETEKSSEPSKSIPKHVGEREPSSHPSDNENSMVHLALDERKKLVERAKRRQLPE